ncbi:hypothetical protein R1sor_000423 [Riccia sorocarpa]|uniref:Uncharacterized protein n=1 Tax=Riccia sorocarpa TaxID=122646 RepID=A0ABD3GUS0_9MARC
MAPRSPVRQSLRCTVVDVPPDPRRVGESSRGTVGHGRGRDAGGGGGRGRGRGCTTHGEAAEESESDSAGDAPEPHDPLGRPVRPLRRRMVGDIFSEVKEEPEPGAKPRRQVRENPLPEGPYRVSWIPIIDRTRYIRWGYLTSEAVYDACIACCMEFITSFNGNTSSGVVRGRRIRIDDELVRTVFDVPTGTQMISPCIRSSKLHDWMPIRDDVGKRYRTRFCGIEGWDVMLQVIQMVFFASRRPRTVSGRFLRYLHGRFLGCVTPWEDTRLARYNISGLIAESIRLRDRTKAEYEAGVVVPDGGFPLPGGDDSSSENGDSTHREQCSGLTERHSYQTRSGLRNASL